MNSMNHGQKSRTASGFDRTLIFRDVEYLIRIYTFAKWRGSERILLPFCRFTIYQPQVILLDMCKNK